MMNNRVRHLRAVLTSVVCAVLMTEGIIPVQIYAVNTTAGSTVMVTAGEASAEIAITPQEAAIRESSVIDRIMKTQIAVSEVSGNEENTENEENNGTAQAEEEETVPQWEVIEIKTPVDLKKLAENCTLDTWSEYKYVKLLNDINVYGHDFTTIPIFNGVFDGQGHEITEYDYSGDGYVTGLFRYIGSEGIVQNLRLYANIGADSEKQVTGGLCGINYGVIKGCEFSGKVSGKTSTGAITAINEVTGLVTGCRNHGNVTGYYYTGGVAGKNYGTVADSYNEGNLNNSLEWVNEEDEMNTGAGIIKNLTGRSGDENPLATTGLDTGGIAGYSKGSIIRCTNSGIVGYEHTGYNVGGIAGRQTGIITMCTNKGEIYGRKDIGGIVGQMEPHLEPDEVQSLSEAVDKLHDLIDVTIEHADGSVDVIGDDINRLSSYADGAVDTSDTMTKQFSSFMNSNMDTLNTFMGRVRYVMNHMPAVLDSLDTAATNLSYFNNDLRRIMKDVDIYSKLSANEAASVNAALKALSENMAKYRDASKRMAEDAKNLADAISKNNTDDIKKYREQLAYDISETTKAAGAITEQLNIIYTIMEPYLGPAREALSADIARANSDFNKTIESVKSATRSLRSIMDYLNSQSELKTTKLGSDWDNSKDQLHSQLNGVFDAVSALSAHSTDSSHQTNSDLEAVNDQLNTVFHIISDDIDGLGAPNKALDDIYTDVSDTVIEQIRSGRVDSSENTGTVNGDINIGGIAGAMDIDEDDPESSAAGDVEFSLGEKYLLRNVICDCKNDSDIISKKDGAGGIVGYMGQGIITACEGYGFIKSTEGGYVGGVAGQSLSIVRNSNTMANLSGSGYVGGITGYGTTITGCIAFPTFIETVDRTGAIAGQVERDSDTQEAKMGVISANYFVSASYNGIDGVSYKDIAEPVSYYDLALIGAPPAFMHPTVNYRITDIDDNEVDMGKEEIPYGTPLDKLNYPEVPDEEGYYISWNDTSGELMDGVRIVNGEYIDIVSVIASTETYPDTEKPLAYMDGSFERESVVSVKTVDDPGYLSPVLTGENAVIYDVTVSGLGVSNKGDYKIRLYNPYEEAVLYKYEDGAFKELQSTVRNEYLETGTEYLHTVYAVAEKKDFKKQIILASAGIAGLLILLIVIIRIIVKRRRAKKGSA